MGASCEFRLLLLFLFLMGSLRLAMSPQDWTYLIDTEPLAISGLRKAAIRNGVPVADAWQESASNKDFSLSAFNSSNWTMTSMTMTSSGSESNEGVCSFGCWGGRCFSISLSVLRGQSHQPSALYHQDPSVTGNVNQSHCHAKMVRYSYYSRTKLGRQNLQPKLTGAGDPLRPCHPCPIHPSGATIGGLIPGRRLVRALWRDQCTEASGSLASIFAQGIPGLIQVTNLTSWDCSILQLNL